MLSMNSINRQPSGESPERDVSFRIADILSPCNDAYCTRVLEEYRLAWEAMYGPTDLTKHYVTMWPADAQRAMLRHSPETYFQSMPPYCQDFVHNKLKTACSEGWLDVFEPEWIQLYVTGRTKRHL